ncbi:nucleoside-diphosphate kinase [Candidatus Saccharibacteria bacterium]|nr:nucleoside-diphosphate kinase [Candidatus Saccharibacteria bacterium]
MDRRNIVERTFVILKPDTVQRAITGEIITRFERAGLKIIGMKMMSPGMELLKEHYPDDLIPIVGNKTKKDWDEFGIEYSETAEELGDMIVKATREFMQSAPVIAIVLQGGHAVEIVRKLVGTTGPKDSPAGTIRGDYAHLSLGRASMAKKGAANIIHASGSVDEAKKEISMWFDDSELFDDYKTVHEHITHV